MIESAATGVVLLRPRQRRTRRRALMWVGAAGAALGVVSLGVVLLLLGPLATFPATTYSSADSIRLTAGDRVAVVPVDEGWTRLGVLPAPDRAELVSPDGRYELEVRLLPAGAVLDDELAAMTPGQGASGGAVWKSETSTSDVTARHLDFVSGDSAETVVGVTYADGTALILRSHVAAADADRYRPLTAAIVGVLGPRR